MNDFVPTPEQATQAKEMMRHSLAQLARRLAAREDAWAVTAHAEHRALSDALDALPDDAPYPEWEAINTRILAMARTLTETRA